jgi:aromatic ring-opening dioxygenase catalytic subunit (LigB family)
LTQINVDIKALSEMGAKLRALREEFNGMGNTVHGFEEAVGNHRVSERLGDFAGNWSEKREKIAKLIDDIANYADAAAEAYGQLESDMSTGFDHAGGG